jgi:hypothetical protein
MNITAEQMNAVTEEQYRSLRETWSKLIDDKVPYTLIVESVPIHWGCSPGHWFCLFETVPSTKDQDPKPLGGWVVNSNFIAGLPEKLVQPTVLADAREWEAERQKRKPIASQPLAGPPWVLLMRYADPEIYEEALAKAAEPYFMPVLKQLVSYPTLAFYLFGPDKKLFNKLLAKAGLNTDKLTESNNIIIEVPCGTTITWD